MRTFLRLPHLAVLVFPFALAACGGGEPVGDEAADTGTDTTGAQVTDTAACPDPEWDCDVSAFFATYCVACHDSSPMDYTTLAEVQEWAEPIRCGVAPVGANLEGCDGEMPGEAALPPIGGPGDEERWRIVEWIDAGMP